MKNGKKGGFITVFVTLIMVPVVVFTGTMVDVARLKLYSSQAAMAADSYGEIVLSEYDNLLKELYGLFAVTQNEEGLQAIQDYVKYTKYSFAPNGDDSGLTGFMPYKDAELNIDYSVLENSCLSETNILMTQISEFMKFRVAQSVLEQADILDILGEFDSMSADMDAVKERNDITNDSAEALGKIEEYYEILDCIAEYPDYIEKRKSKYEEYANNLQEISASSEYADYVYYINNKAAIDAAKQRVEEAEEARKNIVENSNEGDDTTFPEASAEDKALADKYVDVGAYLGQLDQKLSDTLLSSEGNKIQFGEVGEKIDDLDKKAKELETTLQSLSESINNLKAKLSECSDEEFKKNIMEEIKDLENITNFKEDFVRTVELLRNNQDAEKDTKNQELWEQQTEELKSQKESLIAGNGLSGEFSKTIDLEWYDFQDDQKAKKFYDFLDDLCAEEKASKKGNKKAADEKIENAEEVADNAKKEIEKEESTEARDIPSAISTELKGSASKGKIPGLGDFLTGGASLSTMGIGMLDKFLVTEYDYGMFSSRVSGIKPEEESDGESSSSSSGGEEYFDQSLTQIKMSKDVNYLYGAELEYLIAGYDKSADNLTYTRNVICGIRMTSNFISTYTIKELNNAINTIAKTAAELVAATGIGAPAAALIKVAVSGALRMTVATLETVSDWTKLKNREKVVFYKSSLDDLTAVDAVKSFLEGQSGSLSGGGGTSDEKHFKMSYEDYLFVLMCLFTSGDTLVSRTSNLITLNVNQSQNSGDTLNSLDFKMSKAYTAIESNCDVNLKFVIVPKNFVDMFMPDDTKAIIQKQDDGSYGYSIIRGY